MSQRKVLLCFCILMLLIMAGCWSKKELNQLAIVVGMAIDQIEDQYMVSIQVVEPEQVTPQKGGDGGRAPVTLYEGRAESISAALRKMTTDIPRKPYLSHLRVLVIGEALAREGIEEVLDYISRNHEFRTDFYIMIAKEKMGRDILTVYTELEKIPANKLFDSLETSEEEWAPTKKTTLDKLIIELLSGGKQLVMTGIEMRGSVAEGQTQSNVTMIKSSTILVYSGLSVFKGTRLIGWLSEEESKAYNYILGDVKRTIGHIPCPSGGRVSIEIERTKSKVSGVVKNGQPQIAILLRGEANVAEVGCSIDLTKIETITELEGKMNQIIKEMIEHVITVAKKKYKTDIFGFGDTIERADSQAWKQLKQDWDQQFVDLPVHVEVKVDIKSLGTLGNSFLK